MLEDLIKQNQLPDLELLAKQVVDGFIIGLHRSPFHGFSVEFAEHRLYNPGDNLRHIDWKVYGRSDRMFTKKYEEETNLKCCIAIDTSSSMRYKNQEGKSKLQQSIIAAAALIEFLRRQMDASSLALFNTDITLLTKAGTSSAHKRLLFSHLEQAFNNQPTEKKTTKLSENIHELAERLSQRNLVIIFSDLLDDEMQTEELIQAIQHLRYNKHEVIIFAVGDKKTEWDFELPDRPVELVDMETGATLKVTPADVKQYYLGQSKTYFDTIQEQCLRLNTDFVHFDIQEQPQKILNAYLIKRSKIG